LPFCGNGILEVVSTKIAGTSPIMVDDRGCADVPLYGQLGCNCWSTPWQQCTHPVDYCRKCTKDYPKQLGTGANRVASRNVRVRLRCIQCRSFVAGCAMDFNSGTT